MAGQTRHGRDHGGPSLPATPGRSAAVTKTSAIFFLLTLAPAPPAPDGHLAGRGGDPWANERSRLRRLAVSLTLKRVSSRHTKRVNSAATAIAPIPPPRPLGRWDATRTRSREDQSCSTGRPPPPLGPISTRLGRIGARRLAVAVRSASDLARPRTLVGPRRHTACPVATEAREGEAA